MKYIYGLITGMALTLFVTVYGLENLIEYFVSLVEMMR